MPTNKRKIINDPIYGFVTIPSELIYDLINHPTFQRLRRIKQLGLTNLVYPGALHTRFHHAIGAMHLMQEAVFSLRQKDVIISDEEQEAVLIAILLHDIGHGPFSHTLEHTLVKGISHETISSLLMDKLNKEFNGKLNLALKIFNGKYKRRFLHQLVSSQLDMDRLDYLKRLNERYEAWISTYDKGKLLIIDIDNNRFPESQEDLGRIINSIDAEINGLF